MNLEKRLYISGEEVPLARQMISLKLSLGSKAIFTIQAEHAPERYELVRLDIGYEHDLFIFFEGYIDKIQSAENGFFKITVKENAGILSQRWPISLEHPTAIDVLDQLALLTGLDFKYPDTDYMRQVIPNFVHQGNGYQCLDELAKAFAIEDCIWCQDTDQNIYVGSYADSRFAGKPMSIPAEFTSRQTSNSVTFVPYPMLRPGRVMNGHRITRVDLIEDEMTAYWQPASSEATAQKQQIYNDFPELSAGYHLPLFGRVEAVRDAVPQGKIADSFRPRYAVDVQMLDADLQPDSSVPVYRSIPLPIAMGGVESGLLAYPLEGMLVEIAFAYGRSDRPIIRGIYGLNHMLPSIEPGEQLQQQRDEVSRRIDAAGNITDKTDQQMIRAADQMQDQAQHYQGGFGQHQLDIREHSQENIAGKKQIEALGAVELLAGDNLELGSLGNLHVATAGDWITTVGQLRNTVIQLNDQLKIMGNRLEVIEKDWEASAANMRFTADLITMNGGKGVVQGDCICAFTGKKHSDLSSTVKAGK
ncbi:hypothetical protein [Vibrio gazogenes]|uniref:Gp5/Type VI secretion system Vgr protein OB-fold domain-containing protein n=1 Tax=Vibrio gazogenes DSM 21264 = NBRC 103151 TaxID=1123492 RepID=A0A1M5C9H5_VIBGA|nr:hypothetical protein [Vibrio gazogenes]USP16282.1 hypothetical protein MKS89_18035 [Vibrio gazogenes]SHF51424.1 hypothetical protein SAMN02745781_02500 [Vibrio gazogenes DSM 21264] [Vibrio gazogenes DSM 21264 = NBRC 103151]SJN55391.1 hypothetical protein BQ6471_01531 [Vibrio gazogenes]